MSYYHEIAAEFKKRNNSTTPPWFTGVVLSPSDEEDDRPLVISCYDGEVMLRQNHLQVLDGVAVYEGDTAALVGNPFGSDNTKILLVGKVM